MAGRNLINGSFDQGADSGQGGSEGWTGTMHVKGEVAIDYVIFGTNVSVHDSWEGTYTLDPGRERLEGEGSQRRVTVSALAFSGSFLSSERSSSALGTTTTERSGSVSNADSGGTPWLLIQWPSNDSHCIDLQSPVYILGTETITTTSPTGHTTTLTNKIARPIPGWAPVGKGGPASKVIAGTATWNPPLETIATRGATAIKGTASWDFTWNFTRATSKLELVVDLVCYMTPEQEGPAGAGPPVSSAVASSFLATSMRVARATPPDSTAPPEGAATSGTQTATAPDAGESASDVATADAGIPDAGAPDAGAPDAGAPDAGILDPDVQVQVIPYDHWLPRGNLSDSGKPGAAFVTVIARLQSKGGGPTNQKAQMIVFELTDVSREPGVCINHPPGASAQLGLRFSKDAGAPDAGTADAGTTDAGNPDAGSPLTKTVMDVQVAEAKIESYDFGAYGDLKVTAHMKDGLPIQGHLVVDSNPIITLPKRTSPNSKIADAWKSRPDVNAVGLTDDDDREAVPVGNGVPGDGLSLYEEYRGAVILEGNRLRYRRLRILDSQGKGRKKLFVCYHPSVASLQSLLEQGARIFEGFTGLTVITLDPGNVPKNRTVNFLSSARFRLGEQHCVAVGESPPPLPGHTVSDSYQMKTVPRFGPPKYVDWVLVRLNHPKLQDPTYVPFAFAHELCHCVGVPHHGGQTVVDQEDLEKVTHHVNVALDHGAYSGPQDCIMRYRGADFIKQGPTYYRWDAPGTAVDPSRLLAEARGVVHDDGPYPYRLCEGGEKDSLVGPAGNGFVNCINKIVVKDS